MTSLEHNAPTGQDDIIAGILPRGTVNILAGGSGGGKTTILAEFCARILAERPICGHATHRPPGGIFYLAADRVWDTDHAIWFRKAGCPPIPHLSLAEEDIPSYLYDWKQVENLWRYCMGRLHPDPNSLLIVDPMTPMFVAGDINNQRHVATTLLWMNRWAQTHDLTILATAYQGKQKNDPKEGYRRQIDKIAGSMAFAGYSHTQMYIGESEHEPGLYVFGWKGRHAPEQTFEFVRDRDTGLFVPYAPLTIEGAILDLFPPVGEGITFDQLWEAYGLATPIPCSRATFYRSLKKLVELGKIVNLRRGVWGLAKVH